MSTNNNHPLDQHFREQLESYSSPGPKALEEDILERVQQKAPPRSSFWMERVALILILGSLTFFQSPWEREDLRLPETGLPQATRPAPAAEQGSPKFSTYKNLPQLKAPGWKRLRSTPAVAPQNLTVNSSETSPNHSPPTLLLSRKGLKIASSEDLEIPPLPHTPAIRGNLPDRPDPGSSQAPLAMVIKMPSEGYFAGESKGSDRVGADQRLWNYATQQFQRVLQGDKPQLPAFRNEPFLAFNLPSKPSILKAQ